MDFTFSFLEEQIIKADKILILTHLDPDGDALGSVMAIKYIMEDLGKNPDVSLAGKVSSGLKVTPEIFTAPEVDPSKYDLIIILDTNNPQRTGINFLEKTESSIIIIDHHLLKEDKIKNKNYYYLIDSQATATCEIIYDLLKKENKTISNKIASFLLLGIYSDSGGFFHSNTTPALLKKVKDLLQKGVLFKNITQSAFKGKSVQVLNFWGEKITNAIFFPQLKFILTKYTQKELDKKGINQEEISGLVNLLNMSNEALFSLLLNDTGKGKIKGSLRSSERKNFNVNMVSRILGGGGHRLAAGFEVAGKIVDKDKNIYVKKV